MKSLTGLALIGVGILLFSGCRSTDDASVKVVVENQPKILVSEQPRQFLDPIDTSSERAINAKLTFDNWTHEGTCFDV